MRYLISILGLALVVGVGYFAVAQFINTAHGQSSGVVPATQSASGLSIGGSQVLSLLNSLSRIKLDGKIFADPNFLSLQDWSVEIAAQNIGRQNPYLPTYSAVPVSSSTPKVNLPAKKATKK